MAEVHIFSDWDRNECRSVEVALACSQKPIECHPMPQHDRSRWNRSLAGIRQYLQPVESMASSVAMSKSQGDSLEMAPNPLPR